MTCEGGAGEEVLASPKQDRSHQYQGRRTAKFLFFLVEWSGRLVEDDEVDAYRLRKGDVL